MSTDFPLRTKHLNNYEVNISESSSNIVESEKEFSYYSKLLDLSKFIKNNEVYFEEYAEDVSSKHLLQTIRNVIGDCVPNSNKETALSTFNSWFERIRKPGDCERLTKIYDELLKTSLELFEIAYNSFENIRKEEELQKKLQTVLKNSTNKD